MEPRQPDKPDLSRPDPDSTALTRDLPLRRPSPSVGLNPFGSLNQEILALIERNMAGEQFAPGQDLMRKGDPGTSLMVVEEGQVEVSVEQDGERLVITRAGKGEILGEMALLSQGPRMATVTAITPVRVRSLSAERFDELATRYPRISALLTLLLASRLGMAPHDAMTGTTFEGYRILQCVGHGGMSVVYEAEDSVRHRRVALKMMSHRLLYDPVARDHFQREADIVESFDHPNIARMYGRFEAFRTSFIVMEFCEGISISHVMKSKEPLPEEVVRRILGQAAAAITHAHGAGIVHRDVKPSNIMVTQDGTVKLIDFGLAGQVDKESLAPALFGTPNYMAPEQMTGGAIGRQIDLFALGHVGYEMLSGQRLFRGSTFASLKRRVVECRIPDLAVALPGVTPEFRDVLNGLLQKDPAARRLDIERVAAWAGPVRHERFQTH